MKIALFWPLLLLTTVAFAQGKPETIIRDTINLRGYIYQSDGKPAKDQGIESSYQQVQYTNYNVKLGTSTDSNGYFELKGARPYDTLNILSHELYNIGPYYNRGSRYIVIYLPPLKTFAINSDTPIVISKKHHKLKEKAVYHPEPTNAHIEWWLCCRAPSPRGMPFDKKKRFSDFIDSVKEHINYPAYAVENDIEGTVTIRFTVERDGSLTYFKILQGIGYGCDEEVINAIKHMPKWVPGLASGRPVAINETLSVEFKLTDK